MSSFDRRTLLCGTVATAMPLVLAGCFKPMLATDSNATAMRSKVDLPSISGRFGYFLVGSLEDQLGEPQGPEWALSVSPTVSRREVAIASDSSVTRITLIAIANWTLKRRSNGATVVTDRARSTAGYSATTSLFATRQAEQDAERRLAIDIGEQIARRVYAFGYEIGV